MRAVYKVFLLTCFLILLMATAAMAFGEIRYPDRPLNLREGRSPKSAWVGSLYPGQPVRIAFLEDGWVAVFEPGETRDRESATVGYSNVKYLLTKKTRVEPEAWGELVYTPRKLNVRSAPSIKGKQLDMLNVDEQVRIDFPDGDWTMVFSPKATIRSKLNARGFSSAKYFKPVTTESVARPAPAVSEEVNVGSGQGQVGGVVAPPPAAITESSTESEPVASSPWGEVLTMQRKVNLRQERTSGSRYVRTLKPGEKVRVDFLKNGWYAVFRENEAVRKENRAMGYALQSLMEEGQRDEVAAAVSVPVTEPAAVPAPAPEKVAEEPVGGVQKTMVIDKSKFSGAKRPDPTPDKNAHGYQYRLLEKSETKKFGETWITLKIFLATKKLPGSEALEDFATTLWKQHKRAAKNTAILIYLPGMDTEDLAYGVIQFDEKVMLELWVRKTTLFGTDFL